MAFLFSFPLFSTLLMLLILLEAMAAPPNVVAPHCQETCGDISIPYPFGIGDGCFRPGFEVTCNESTPFFGEYEFNIGVKDISLQGQARMLNFIGSNCYNESTQSISFLDLSSLPFKVSSKRNKFTTIGCNTVGFIYGTSNNEYATGCASFCYNNASIKSEDCSGAGCCQTTIPENLNYFETSLSSLNRTNVVDNYPCTYAFVVEDSFEFNKSDLDGYGFKEKSKNGLPLVLDWFAGNETCEEAVKKTSSYACRSTNSECIDVENNGYLCNCSEAYKGNPYLPGGCEDIDECTDSSGICTNIRGGYNCTCPTGHSSDDPKTQECVPDSERNQGFPLPIKLVIGISIGVLFIFGCVFFIILGHQRRKIHREKHKFFQQNGGLKLFEEIRSKQVDTVKIYTKHDLEKATDNFDKNRELGRGGHGTVYKGNLDDGREVAIKRSKVVAEVESEEFVREMIIISQLNHKNVVRLLGCCLEVEIPMLVYEFIPNGTLFDYIHNNHRVIPLDIRLRIAGESAEALAYLHSWASPPILHGDVKSLNILLDRNYVPKMSDFGASRMLSIDETQFITMVQGTLGYLDPEFLIARQLTTKSDVYSFGVVIVEIITRKKPIYCDENAQGKSLAFGFLDAMKDRKLEEFLDDQIIDKGNMDVLQEVAELAKECLNVKGDERPTMREVAERLHVLRGFLQQPLVQHAPEECERLLGESSMRLVSDTTGYNTLHNQMAFDIEIGR
ncbi:wall-associated receptor kinase-like 16 [Canna indica]|uniref:Wall-associated receptor kinase-like 16 n=1 Tax=Canna indica TaxID=4628 RepID=A0AAQ3KVF9_9LILI|nr:wall-associated receptor kinase-like 16 [Canna indica]